jgi:hypothetical protein
MELGINLLDPAAKIGLTIFTEKKQVNVCRITNGK